MNCRICSKNSNFVHEVTLIKKYSVKYYHCPNCGFLQTEEPYWLDESYNSAIGIDDTGLMKRNILFSKITSVLISILFNRYNKFLDYAGGYGIFVRLMRDLGFDFYWSDPFAQNLLARGFEYKKDINIDFITAFECFEHFTDPIMELEKMFKISKNILFSTRLFQAPPPEPKEWWYYSLDSGQHISLYSVQTLKYLSQKYNLSLCTDGKSLHLLSQKKINNSIFNLLKKLSSLGLSQAVNLVSQSRTDADFTFLKKSIGGND